MITRVIAPNPGPLTGPGTNTFIIGDSTGCVVVDPGIADAGHLDTIIMLGETWGGITGIVVTHAHPDHVGGAAELAAQVHAPVLAMSKATDGVPFADISLSDGMQIAAGQQHLTVLATPGHRFDHVCLWHPPSGTLFAGDLIAGVGTVVIAPPEGDMRVYLASLERVAALPLRRIWPGHGDAIDDPHERIAGYIAHRMEREGKVVAALQDAGRPQTLAQLVPVVYTDTDASLHAWAAMSLLAHLLKLEAEGRVSRIGDDPQAAHWQIIT
jgi:glyoxylase-like metal-dependent hydrolase (beta-lactamase superfamily II)